MGVLWLCFAWLLTKRQQKIASATFLTHYARGWTSEQKGLKERQKEKASCYAVEHMHVVNSKSGREEGAREKRQRGKLKSSQQEGRSDRWPDLHSYKQRHKLHKVRMRWRYGRKNQPKKMRAWNIREQHCLKDIIRQKTGAAAAIYYAKRATCIYIALQQAFKHNTSSNIAKKKQIGTITISVYIWKRESWTRFLSAFHCLVEHGAQGNDSMYSSLFSFCLVSSITLSSTWWAHNLCVFIGVPSFALYTFSLILTQGRANRV